MNSKHRDTTRLAVVKYSVRDWPNNPQRRAKETKVYERPLTDAQSKLWETLCDPLTTDEPLRRAMLDAAIRVKHDHMKEVIKSLGVSPETEAVIEQSMQTYREALHTQV